MNSDQPGDLVLPMMTQDLLRVMVEMYPPPRLDSQGKCLAMAAEERRLALAYSAGQAAVAADLKRIWDRQVREPVNNATG